MDKKRLKMDSDMERHTCQAWNEGDWVFFHCPDCGFKRKLNWKTSETQLVQPGNPAALHSGMNVPFQMQEMLLEEN